MAARIMLRKLSYIVFCVLLSGCVPMQRPVDIVAEPYLLDTGLLSRSICFENPTGAPGEGGKAEFPKTNRELLIAGAQDAFAEVDELFRDALANWTRV